MAELELPTTDNSTPQEHHDDIDEDDDQLNASHKIVTDLHKPTAPGTDQANIDAQNLVKSYLNKYLHKSISKDHLGFVQCHIKREKYGLTKGFATIFSLYFDGKNENDQIARKHITIGGHSEYFIGTNPENPTNLTDANSIAKLRGINLTSTEYILHDHQNPADNQYQSTAIIYNDHIFAGKEPRKLIILLRDSEKQGQSLKENETIIDQWRSGHATDLIELQNTPPTYNEESKTYVLNLRENRVKLPSHKNFQLVSSNEDAENNVAMQFGRIDDNTFAMDYRHPLSAVQAFAIALSSFHNRFRN